MKILIIAPRYHTNLYHRIKALQKMNHKVFLFVLYKQNSEKYDILKPTILKQSRINLILDKFKKCFKNKNTIKIKLNFPQNKELKQKINEIKPDILIVKNLQSALSLMALWHARKIVKKSFILIQTNKHYIYNKKKKILIWFLKEFFKVNAIITPLKNKLDKKNTFFKYIPFIIDVDNFDKRYFKNNKINILDIGKFTERKDHLILLRAIKKLNKKYNIHLTIIGEKMDTTILQKIKKYIAKNNLDDVVDLKTNLKYDIVMNTYKDFDLFILPSYNEPASYSIIEAMANKLPVICSDTCGTNCYIKEGVNGYIFESHNLDSLIDKIERIIKNNKIKIMGKNSFSLCKKNHSINSFKNKIYGVL